MSTIPAESASEVQQRWWRKLGPGLITGAADDDPSGIATYSQAGAQFGYGTCWTLLLTFPLMVGIQLASARIGRVTGKGLASNFALICPGWLVRGLVGLLLLANVINLGADLNAMGDAATLLLRGASSHAGTVLFVVAFGALSLLLQVWLPYRRYVNVLKWLTLPLLAYVGLAFAVHVDWGQALRGAVTPHIDGKDGLTTVVAILGTTISPYLFFWQASQEVEEIARVPADRALCDAPAQVREQTRRMKLDTWVGMAFSNGTAFFMIVASAATLHAQGITYIDSSVQAASALKPIAGEAAFALFALGIIGTGMLALPVLAGSAAYAMADLFGWRAGLDRPLKRARAFYGVIAAAMVVGALIGSAGWNPISALFWSAVINAVISVPVMAAVMLAAGDARVMGKLTLSPRWRRLGWGATAVMAAATLAMLALSMTAI
ncbi:divalent metal cation transporter [Paucibacter sp. R3-3]|uniref:Divalent metal cation transporter n=1 Tax=Roseateles agri TaxID=3098619 RepID=A0ABU5DJR4_9BURK|nr:divalent metal cation transporter [Paucibacter sp. R3-3]MDY0745347.1 divalent metal cation transporter [Paucibacter sp. R3-3]